jgi:hypothetical protein
LSGLKKTNILSNDATIQPRTVSEIKSLISEDRSSREFEKAQKADSTLAPKIVERKYEKESAVKSPRPLRKPAINVASLEWLRNLELKIMSAFFLCVGLGMFVPVLATLAPWLALIVTGFFVIQKEKWKSFSSIALSGFFLCTGLGMWVAILATLAPWLALIVTGSFVTQKEKWKSYSFMALFGFFLCFGLGMWVAVLGTLAPWLALAYAVLSFFGL